MRVLFLVVLLSLGVLGEHGKRYLFSGRRGPPPPTQSRSADLKAVATKFIDQPLDNFDANDTKSWKMRYITNDQYFKKNGPILVMLGGEWTINSAYVTGGHMFTIGRDIDAYLIYTEHRFYGQSVPTIDSSTSNLKFLIVDQALADVANLVKELKSQEDFKESKVVVFGGSYAGNMATWMRLTYPDLIDGAVASSGPVLAKSDFFEYLETVNDALNTSGGVECVNVVQEAIEAANEMLTTPNGTITLSQKFKTCDTINTSNPLDVQAFFSVITESFSGLVQYASGTSIKRACDLLTADEGTQLDRLVEFVHAQLGSVACYETDYKATVDALRNTSLLSTEITGRMWFYQTCTEYGYYQTTNSDKQPFGQTLPESFFVDNFCPDIYGEGIGPESVASGVIRTNAVYGALSPNITKLISIHGTIDPWHRLGITNDLSPDSPAVLVTGTSHCVDLQAPNANDNDEMKAARKLVREKVIEWTM